MTTSESFVLQAFTWEVASWESKNIMLSPGLLCSFSQSVRSALLLVTLVAGQAAISESLMSCAFVVGDGFLPPSILLPNLRLLREVEIRFYLLAVNFPLLRAYALRSCLFRFKSQHHCLAGGMATVLKARAQYKFEIKIGRKGGWPFTRHTNCLGNMVFMRVGVAL